VKSFIDQGKVAECKGKNLDGIDVSEIVELEKDEDSLELDHNSSVPRTSATDTERRQ